MRAEDLDGFKLSKKAREKLKDKNLLKRELQKGKSAQQILGISEQSMAKFYQAAKHLFENNQFLNAADAFMFLITLNAHKPDFWLGLAMSTQQLGKFDDAIDAYEMAAYYKPDNPVPYFYMAKCFFALNDRESAKEALELAIEYSEDKKKYSQLKKEALEAKKILEFTRSQNK